LGERLSFEKIITGQPTKAGRGMKDRVSQVERAAEELGLAASVERTGPLSRNEELTELVSAHPPDLMFVIDFGQVVREPFLNGPRHGCLNIHPSLLPRWRGAAPVQRALMNGDERTGVTVFRLVEEMDAGPILAQAEVPVTLETTSEELFEVLAGTGSQIAIQGVESLMKGNARFSAQNSDSATYAVKLTKEEAEVSWTQNYLRVHNVVRAFASSSGAFAVVEGRRLKLWGTTPVEMSGEEESRPGQVLRFLEGDPVIVCEGGALRLREVQNEGKRRISGVDWACGGRLETGGVLR
jgi:methionyl-tRNA formyltransferase